MYSKLPPIFRNMALCNILLQGVSQQICILVISIKKLLNIHMGAWGLKTSLTFYIQNISSIHILVTSYLMRTYRKLIDDIINVTMCFFSLHFCYFLLDLGVFVLHTYMGYPATWTQPLGSNNRWHDCHFKWLSKPLYVFLPWVQTFILYVPKWACYPLGHSVSCWHLRNYYYFTLFCPQMVW